MPCHMHIHMLDSFTHFSIQNISFSGDQCLHPSGLSHPTWHCETLRHKPSGIQSVFCLTPGHLTPHLASWGISRACHENSCPFLVDLRTIPTTGHPETLGDPLRHYGSQASNGINSFDPMGIPSPGASSTQLSDGNINILIYIITKIYSVAMIPRVS